MHASSKPSRSSRGWLASALVLGLGVGCTYDEGLTIENMTGTVVVPEEAATRTIEYEDEDGQIQTQTITDRRFIGPVYLGLYPSVQDGLFQYPHPEMGPSFQEGLVGDTYPYGGTTIGDIRFPCLEFLVCRVVSGRYRDFDEMVEWFDEVMGEPIRDPVGNPVNNGDYIAQTCFELVNYVHENEIRLTGDLDFEQRSDGAFEAEFTIWQQEYFEDAQTGEGFNLWAFMDAPSMATGQFATCNPEVGQSVTHYSRRFNAGRAHRDVLNRPSTYISPGDWVSDGVEVRWDQEKERFGAGESLDDIEITLSHEVR